MGFWKRFFGSNEPLPDESQAAFAERVADLLRARSDVQRVEVGPSGREVMVVFISRTSHRLFTDAVFAESRGKSLKFLQQRLGALLAPSEVTKSWAKARGALIPVLHPHSSFLISVDGRPFSAQVVRRAFLPLVDMVLMLDTSETMSTVNEDTLDAWGVDAPTAFQAALDHFTRDSRHDRLEPVSAPHGVAFRVTAGDGYESSRLLIPGWLESLRSRVDGNPIAVVPSRNVLLVTGDATPGAIEWLARTGLREYETAPRRISPAVYSPDEEGGVTWYEGDADSQPTLDRLELRLRRNEYEHQREFLSGYFDDGYASLSIEEPDDGPPYASTVWIRGVETLLPRADVVQLIVLDANDDSVRGVDVGWDDVVDRLEKAAVAGPPRWKTGAFPTDDELDAM